MKAKSPNLQTVLKKERDPRRRVHAMLSRAEGLSRSDNQQSVDLCQNALAESKAAKMKDLVAASSAMLGKSSLLQGDRKNAADSFKQALKIYERQGDLDAALETECNLASAKLSTGNEKESLIRLHRILHARASQAIDPTHSPAVTYAIVSAWTDAEKTKVASASPHTHHSNAQSFFIPRSWEDRVLNRIPSATQIENNQQLQLANLYDALGFAYIVIREHHKAASLLEEELAIYKRLKDRDRIAHATNNLGYIHTLLGNGVLALEYAQLGLKLSRQLGDMRGVAINQRSLAETYLNTGKVTQGKRLAMQSFQTGLDLGMVELACRALVTLTRYERLHGSMAKAAEINAKALRLLNDRPKSGAYLFFALQQLLIEHAKALSRAVYKKLLALHKIAKDQGLEVQHEAAQEIARVAEELQLLPDAVKWFRKVHEHQIERLNSEQRSALASLQTEQELERVAREREVQKLKMDKLELKLNAKAREAELLAVQLAKKGSVIAMLTDQLAVMKATKPQYSAQTIDAVVDLIEASRHKDKEYENLEARAEALHHDFVVSLIRRFPALTSTEKRICVLLKLGLNTIDIANVLFTSVRTIETHALSIRRKMGIPGTMRLSKYIISYQIEPLEST